MSYCTATRRNGEPCRAQALPERRLCWAHDPEMRQKADAARRRGGENKANAVRARKKMGADLHDISKMIEAALAGVYKGTMTPQQGQSIASLAGAWVRLHDAGEVQARIEELEARLEQRPGAAGWRR